MNGISADLVMKNGNIITVDALDTIAEAVAVFDEKFVRVGSNDDVAPLIGETTKVIDLAGRTLVPGFIDAHTHPVSTGEFFHGLDLIDAAAELCPSIADLQERIRERVKETPKGDWIGGRNYVPEKMRKKDGPPEKSWMPSPRTTP